MSSQETAIVLSGGGARGAYEAGVVSGIMQVLHGRGLSQSPFGIFAGTSVGAINAVWLAAHADAFDCAISGLLNHWGELNLGSHLRLDLVRLLTGKKWRRWLSDWKRPDAKGGRSLLDPRAFETLLHEAVPYARLHRNVEQGVVRALVVAALCLSSGRTTLFAELAPDARFSPSRDPRRRVEEGPIGASHVLASAALPFLFPARRIGARYYSDGGLRFNTPISPAIRCGASRLVVISLLRSMAPQLRPEELEEEVAYPSAVTTLGKIVNTLLLDPVRYDLQVLHRLNRLIETLEESLSPKDMERVRDVMQHTRGLPYRRLETLVFEPSIDIGRLAYQRSATIARTSLVGSMLRSLADIGGTEADLLSFLLFDTTFIRELIDLGQRDAKVRKDEIEAFFFDAGADVGRT